MSEEIQEHQTPFSESHPITLEDIQKRIFLSTVGLFFINELTGGSTATTLALLGIGSALILGTNLLQSDILPGTKKSDIGDNEKWVL